MPWSLVMIDNTRSRVLRVSRGVQIALGALAITLSGALALPATPALADEGISPLIGPITVGGQSSGEGIVEAQIDPEGHETTYAITLNCPGQDQCQRTEGQLPADQEEHAVSLKLTGLQPGSSYRFEIYAHSTAGVAAWSGEFTVQKIPPGAAPNGGRVTEGYTPPELPWANQSGKEGAERTVAEQRAKEHEEQQAKEAAASHAAEIVALKRGLEEARASALREEAEHSACIVPALKGDTLSAARRALSKAHCRPGAIHHIGRQYSIQRVSTQGAQAGDRLAHNSRVALWLGARKRRR
jgi:hypothetical protein